ncbi:MAG: SWIM zinc finger domain-containing protein, partial [Anaerolineae bacterium]
MTQEPKLTEYTVRHLATDQSFSRGEDYYHSGAVLEVLRRGDMLSAEVEGTSYEPYQVTIRLDGGGVADAECSCPYDWGGYCKHIVAVLLTYVR